MFSYDLGTIPAPVAIIIGKALDNRSRQYHLNDVLSISLGAHQVKVGGDYRLLSPIFYGALSISAGNRSIYGPDSASLGTVYLSMQTYPTYGLTVPALSLFAQDTWRLRRSVTLTWGGRWEVDPAPRTNNGIGFPSVTGFRGYSSLSDLVPVITGKPLYSTRYGEVAPRIGLAWQLSNHAHRVVTLRFGGGLFYDLGQDGFANVPFFSGPTLRYGNAPLPVSLAIASAKPQTDLESGQPNAFVSAPGYHLPRIYQGSATIQTVFGPQSFSAAYIGALGRGLLGQGTAVFTSDPNSPDYSDRLGSLTVVGNNGSSQYSALQLQFNRRLNHGFQGMVSYTWSHAIDDVQIMGDPRPGLDWGSNYHSISEFLNPSVNRGLSDYDIRHGMTGVLIWRVPRPRRSDHLFGAVTDGWSLEAMWFARSAPVENILAENDHRRPNLVPGIPVFRYSAAYPGGKAINPDALTDPDPSAIQGTLGRNALRTFAAWQVDAAVHREVRIGANRTIEIRGECFNVLNHPNFASFYSTLGGGLSSTVHYTGMLSLKGGLDPLFQVGGARSVQLGLRVSF